MLGDTSLAGMRPKQALTSQRARPDTPGIPFRVRLGVTGHRTLRDPESVARRVEDVLGWIETTVLPVSPATPVAYTVVSALAEGADRLVPKVVLERRSAELLAVPPLPIEEFMKDFESQESRAEFVELLRQAIQPPTEPAQEERRPVAYATGGRALVDRIDILIAVWDQEGPRGVGGTATVVDYARRKGVPIVVVSAADASRIDFPEPPAEPSLIDRALDLLEFRNERAEPDRLDILRTEYEALDAFNCEQPPPQKFERGCKDIRGTLAPAGRRAGIGEGFADWALADFVRADLLARGYQRKYTHLALFVFLAAATAVAIAAAVQIFHGRPRWLLPEVLLMISVVGVVFYVRWRRSRVRWIAYRSLAENLRSAPFIAILGVSESGDELGADPFLPWFQRAFTEIWRGRAAISVPDGPGRLAEFLDKAWIGDQVAYHARASDQFQRRHQLFTLLIYLTFLATFGCAIADMGLGLSGTEWGKKWVVFSAISLPAFGAALGGYRELRQYALHAERSRRAMNRLESTRVGMRAEETAERAKARAAGAYAIMLEENLDWFGVLEFSDLTLVV
jgi:hypothetical protein